MSTRNWLTGLLAGKAALVLSDSKGSVFWILAFQCWRKSRNLSTSITGPSARRSLALRLVDQAIRRADAADHLSKAISDSSAHLVGWSMIALARMNKLNDEVLATTRINRNERVPFQVCCFVTERSLDQLAERLLKHND